MYKITVGDDSWIVEVLALMGTTAYCIPLYHESGLLHSDHSFMYVRQKRKGEWNRREENTVDKQY